MISYKMQYPKFLFKKEQRDYENDSFKIENTQYLINTANPFNIDWHIFENSKDETGCGDIFSGGIRIFHHAIGLWKNVFHEIRNVCM